jgi:hypothetical protein
MKTQSLDEAVFLVTKGFRYTKARAIADIHSEWTFDDCWELEDASKEFWSGTPMVNIQQWLMIRGHMKMEQKRLMRGKHKERKEQVVREMVHPNGTQYWFINGHNKVQHATYGKAKSHNKRIAEGNFYLNRIQAVQKQNELS